MFISLRILDSINLARLRIEEARQGIIFSGFVVVDAGTSFTSFYGLA